MITDRLLLDRAFGVLHAEDYIAWAVEQLRTGADSPNLRILAGLHADFDRDEVEGYFKKTCDELGIPFVPSDRSPRDVALTVRTLYERGLLTPEETVRRMSSLVLEDWGDKLLLPWFYLAEDLDLRGSGYEGCFYPTQAVENLRDTVDQEWTIFELLLEEPTFVPIWDWVRCEDCREVGSPTYKRRSLAFRLSTKLRGGMPNVQWPHCSYCGSAKVVGVGYDPGFRLKWLREHLGGPLGGEGRDNR